MASSISISSDQSFQHDSSHRRLVFNGNAASQNAPRVHKQVKRRRISPLFLMLSMLTVVFMGVFFIWNKIAVNRLASEVDKMQIQYQNIVGKNELLRAEVSRKSTPERIQSIAQEQLGMIFRTEQPVVFELDHNVK